MTGIVNLDLTCTELKHYKQWVKETQDKNIQEYVAEQIRKKLQLLKKQEGRCTQRSILLKKGGYKGSCIWSSKDCCYKVCVVCPDKRTITYGFFSSLYLAENELKRLFEHSSSEIETVARKQQEYFIEERRLSKNPLLNATQNTTNIEKIYKETGGIRISFAKPFINPNTGNQQKEIHWAKSWFKYYSKKGVTNTCVEMDDPLEIFQYREDLRVRLREHKQKQKEAEEMNENE